ncbi:fungal-specific transcription factor domain-containing protein [Chaetomium strumarium]|uniref:Fungal-specific transcription factor domain-containing protein n=1 Tax=Chaetomium strumarium TaxID=1170767 RepID=A0AAJ0GZ88_9PEZI|nr:fungal-specific transcription factor domain-containing protein [Chaetomium strumarium]
MPNEADLRPDAPKEIYRCDVAGCEQKFVRADLLARHRKRHSASYVPRNRLPSFSTTTESSPTATAISPVAGNEARPTLARVPHDAAILLVPETRTQPPVSLPHPAPNPDPRMSHHPGWHHPPMPNIGPCNAIRPKHGYYPREDHQRVPEQHAPVAYATAEFQHDEMSRESFGMWLFDPHARYPEFSVSHLPFMDGGLESTLNNNIHYDYESLTSGRSQLDTPTRFAETDELISEFRRREILRWFQAFREKQPKAQPLVANLVHDSSGDIADLNVEMMRDCLQEYWDRVSPRLPIVHQPTFSCNRCSIFLLMVMVALGAVSLRTRDSTGNLADYGGFADVIILGVRLEILTAEEAQPPVSLWVSQALLLLEFYEKMYSSRRLHERANIYHTVTLTLLRRGSPLIGRSGSESPPEVPSAEHPQGVSLDSHTWWCRWAETEAIHRVVFAAFMMDIIHAAMFGHAADMAPYEIRLPLPCDDNMWTASNPETVRQLDQNLRMYGIRPISFLDGLKRALHGKEVKTHSFGRMIIMSGLLSIGWHLSHRETHLKWLDLTTPSTEMHEAWKKMLLSAFDDWKHSFDAAQGAAGNNPSLGDGPGSNGPVHSAAVIYHLAHISLHVDIIDCQVYAGAKRLLGRKISVRDQANVVARMPGWASLPSTRHAVLHAFRLLHRVLVDPRRSASAGDRERLEIGPGVVSLPPIEVHQSYSCRTEPDPHRPWVMYYAALSIWSFVQAINNRPDSLQEPPPPPVSHYSAAGPFRPAKLSLPHVNYRRVAAYLSNIANLPELTEKVALSLGDGLPDLLDALRSVFAEADSELLQEAQERLRVCKEMLSAAAG